MKNSTKLALVIVVIAILAGSAVYFGNTMLQKGSLSPLVYWQTYTNDNYDFSIKYPKDWEFHRGNYDGKDGFFITKSGARLGIFPKGGFEFDVPESTSLQTSKEKIDNKNVAVKDWTLKGDGHFLSYYFLDSIPNWQNGRIDIAVDTKLDMVTLKAVAGTLDFFDMPIKVIKLLPGVKTLSPIIKTLPAGKPVQIEVAVNGYPTKPNENLAEAHVLIYKVKPTAPGVYKGTYAGMQTTGKKGEVVKFVVQPGEVVNFVAFSKKNVPNDAMQKWTFNYPPYKNFTAQDGVFDRLCQVNFLDTSSKMSENACATSFSFPVSDKKTEIIATTNNVAPLAVIPPAVTPPTSKEALPDLKIGKIETNFHEGDLWFFVEVRNEGDVNSCAKNFNVRLQGFTNKNYAYDAVLPKSISPTQQANTKEPVWKQDLCHYTTLDGVKGVNFVFTQPHYDFVKLQAFIDTGNAVKESDEFNNTKIAKGSLGWVPQE